MLQAPVGVRLQEQNGGADETSRASAASSSTIAEKCR